MKDTTAQMTNNIRQARYYHTKKYRRDHLSERYFLEDSLRGSSVFEEMLITLGCCLSKEIRHHQELLQAAQFSSGNTLDFDELFIGVRSGPALYCFDVTNDDGSSSTATPANGAQAKMPL